MVFKFKIIDQEGVKLQEIKIIVYQRYMTVMQLLDTVIYKNKKGCAATKYNNSYLHELHGKFEEVFTLYISLYCKHKYQSCSDLVLYILQ